MKYEIQPVTSMKHKELLDLFTLPLEIEEKFDTSVELPANYTKNICLTYKEPQQKINHC